MFYTKECTNGFEFSDTPQEDFVQVFEKDDLHKLNSVINEASNLWEKLTKEYIDQNGDQGSCVIGAGIEVLVIPQRTPKLKKLKAVKIIDQPRCAQGSICWEGQRLKDVQAFLKENGIVNSKYNAGWMD